MASGTINVKDVYLKSSQRAWQGDTLEFNMSADNVVLYRFTAFSSSGVVVESLFIVRVDGLKWANVLTGSNAVASGVFANGVLTITLPSTSYWVYQLEKLQSVY